MPQRFHNLSCNLRNNPHISQLTRQYPLEPGMQQVRLNLKIWLHFADHRALEKEINTMNIPNVNRTKIARNLDSLRLLMLVNRQYSPNLYIQTRLLQHLAPRVLRKRLTGLMPTTRK